jgi:ribonuclease PH
VSKNELEMNPMSELIAAVSVGIVENRIIVDLDFEQDSNADVDMNLVMTESGKFVEIQGTGEKVSFSKEELNDMIEVGMKAILQLIEHQRRMLE